MSVLQRCFFAPFYICGNILSVKGLAQSKGYSDCKCFGLKLAAIVFLCCIREVVRVNVTVKSEIHKYFRDPIFFRLDQIVSDYRSVCLIVSSLQGNVVCVCFSGVVCVCWHCCRMHSSLDFTRHLSIR